MRIAGTFWMKTFDAHHIGELRAQAAHHFVG